MGRTSGAALFEGLAVIALLAAVGCSTGGGAGSSGEVSGGADVVGDITSGTDLSTEVTPDSSPVVPVDGEFTLLTYNVAGLPDFISKSNPEEFIPQISPLLNGYDLVLVQEDFAYHAELSKAAEHPYQTTPMFEEPDQVPMGDGLNRFSSFPMGPLHRLQWPGCSGDFDCASDCLATKGFSFARVELALGVSVDVYNLHGEAGSCPGDVSIRLLGYQRLVEFIGTWSVGRPVVVAGDFNLRWTDAEDVEPLKMLADAGLTEACEALDCGDEHIDKVYFRSVENLQFEPLTWEVPPEFVDPDGEDLSDHEPVAVHFAWSGIPSVGGAGAIDDQIYSQSLSVVTFNILHGLSDEDPDAQPFDRLEERLEIVGAELASRGDDLVALQEISLMAVADYPDVMDAFLTSLDRDNCPACHALFGAIGGTPPTFDEGDAVGQVTLSRLPQSGPVHNRQVSSMRSVSHLRVDSPLGKVDLYNVHLDGSGDQEDGLAEVDAVLAFVEETSRPEHIILLAGDFNSTPDSSAIERLLDAGFSDLGAGSDLVCSPADNGGCTAGTLPLAEAGNRTSERIDLILIRADEMPASTCSPIFGAAVATGDGVLWPSDHIGLACKLSLDP